MKLWGIFRFELVYQLRRPSTWLIAIALLVISILMTGDGSLAEALHDDFFINSSFAVAKTTVACSLLWLLVAAFIAGEAGARDVASGMYPLTYSAPVHKGEYLGGRFLAAFILNALLLLVVQAGILIAIYGSGAAGPLIGPFRPAAFLTAYAFLALPNAFFGTAIQFSLATRSGRPMGAYLGSVFLFFMSYIVGIFLFGQGRRDLANLLDPVGVHFILSELSHLWTSYEKSWRVLALEGVVLTNRLLWTGSGIAALVLLYARFRFEHRVDRSLWRRVRGRFARRAGGGEALNQGHVWLRSFAPAQPPAPSLRMTAAPAQPPSPSLRMAEEPVLNFDAGFHVRQTLTITWASFVTTAKSWAGLAMLLVIPLMSVPVIIDQMEAEGVRLLPTTARVVAELTGPLASDPLQNEMSRWVIIPLLIIFFAGELVWRERDAGVAEITDAMPGSEWAPLLGKFLGISLVLVLFTALLNLAGIVAQLILGYRNLELGLYLKTLFGLQLPEYLLFTIVALALHALINQKYIGHLVVTIVYVSFIVLASLLRIEHNMLIYSASPGWSYSAIRGFGGSIAPWLWFKLYWASWALLFAVAARVLWVRGKENGFRLRIQLARLRFTRPTIVTAAAASTLVMALGGFIFYNTNIRNEYLNKAAATALRAEYEKSYARYANTPQPLLTSAKLHIELYPNRRTVNIRGTYHLENRSGLAIDTIHVATRRSPATRELSFDRAARLVTSDDRHGYRIYTLAEPLVPGASLRLSFHVHGAPRGFSENGVGDAVTPNATFLTSRDWLPLIGYQRDREITSAADRREHGLKSRPLIASLHDIEALKSQGDGISFEAVVGTDEDQIAVAPGALRRTWRERGRAYSHFATDGPIGSEWSFASARYEVRDEVWTPADAAQKPVTISIFHFPENAGSVDRIVQSIRDSLNVYTKEFGPYQYSHLTFVERADSGTGMHADASMVSYGSGFAHWTPGRSAESLDLPYAIVAHEMAHQWTVPIANVEGAPVMSEGVAWYYAMNVIEREKGKEQLRVLLSWMRHPHRFPPIRRGEPLMRGLDQYMSYRKGPFALYTMSQYVGRERVHNALRRLRETHDAKGAPLATMLDLYRELKAVTPPAYHYLLHDLFEVNTFWQLSAGKITARPVAAGKWEVTMHVEARKVVFSEQGIERVLPMDELVEVGVFAEAAEDHAELSAPLYEAKHRIRSGKQTIVVTVPGKPALAGIDPHHLVDAEEGENDDNIDVVAVE